MIQAAAAKRAYWSIRHQLRLNTRVQTFVDQIDQTFRRKRVESRDFIPIDKVADGKKPAALRCRAFRNPNDAARLNTSDVPEKRGALGWTTEAIQETRY